MAWILDWLRSASQGILFAAAFALPVLLLPAWRLRYRLLGAVASLLLIYSLLAGLVTHGFSRPHPAELAATLAIAIVLALAIAEFVRALWRLYRRP
jgi:hypothetical protein